MLNYEVCKNWPFEEITHKYSTRFTMLYALGIGMGSDPTDAGDLRFVYEKNLQAVPTMAAVIGAPGSWLREPSTGVNYERLLHGEQDIEFFRPLPVEGVVTSRNKVIAINDKGLGKGAVVVVRRELFDEEGNLLTRGLQLLFTRDEGGYSANGSPSDPMPPSLPSVPQRKAEYEVVLTSLPQAALIYRLSGDYNPLHADPEVAKRAGFERPILHGLCTYGMTARALIVSVLGHDAQRLKRLAVRFSAPVFPGETVRFEIWRESARLLRLRATANSRNVVVLNNGVAEID